MRPLPHGRRRALPMPTAPDHHVTPSWGIADAVVGWVAAQVIAVILGAVALSAAGYSTQTSTSKLPLYLVAVLQVPLWFGLLGAVFYAGERRGNGVIADFGFRARVPYDVVLGGAAGVACQFVLVPIISYPWLEILGKSTNDLSKVARNLTSRATDPAGVVLLVLIVAVGAPFVEELFFRGLLLRALERRFGVGWAIAGSAVVFGFTHFELLQFPALAAFGAVLAWMVIRTGRLGPGIAAHMAFNTVTVVALLR